MGPLHVVKYFSNKERVSKLHYYKFKISSQRCFEDVEKIERECVHSIIEVLSEPSWFGCVRWGGRNPNSFARTHKEHPVVFDYAVHHLAWMKINCSIGFL